ncbi:porin [Variovorax sp. UMC13]|uniref:porin n=1 Tax=Variovorax sp. UMC13 TaxID=1862326 RepID=UPI00287BA239|nr:porin [Variovorax sp. UMC13]
MKRNAILSALALLACGVAGAQSSSATLFGVIDAGVARLSATGGAHATGPGSGGNGTSRLGFRGTEDLGGGFSAGFWLEGQLNNDVGAGATQGTGLDFARRATVSLGGRFGELRLGRDYAPTYLNMNQFDVWGQRGLGTVETTGAARAGVGGYARTANGIAYFLPADLGGLYGSVQYAFGEQLSNKAVVANAAGLSSGAANAATERTGNYYGGRIGYARGSFDVSASYGVFEDAVRSVGTAFYAGDYRIANVGASFDAGVVKPMLLYQRERIDGRNAVADFSFETLAIGATAPVGAGLWRAQVARYSQSHTRNDFDKYSVGYVHYLSKRTQLYGDLARLRNKGTGTVALTNLSGSVNAPVPTAGGASMGYMLGVKHVF